jgi:glycoside/pentoside/hexuronide:cation symporter, GPH family
VQYVLQAEKHIIVLIFILQVVIAVSVIVWQQLSRTLLPKKVIFFIGTGLCIFCALGLIFVRHVIWLYPGCMILGVGIAAIFLIPFSMVPEIIDRDERKVHCRREGVYYGLFVFLQKMATSIGLAVGSILLGIAGLASLEPEDEASFGVKFVLRVLMGVLPAVLFLASLLPMILYPYGKRVSNNGTADFGETLMEEIEGGDYQPPELILEGEMDGKLDFE